MTAASDGASTLPQFDYIIVLPIELILLYLFG